MQQSYLRMGTFGLAVLAAWLLFQLAVGPAAWMQGRGIISSHVALFSERTVFLPIHLAAEMSPACGRWMRSYIAWWDPDEPATQFSAVSSALQ